MLLVFAFFYVVPLTLVELLAVLITARALRRSPETLRTFQGAGFAFAGLILSTALTFFVVWSASSSVVSNEWGKLVLGAFVSLVFPIIFGVLLMFLSNAESGSRRPLSFLRPTGIGTLHSTILLPVCFPFLPYILPHLDFTYQRLCKNAHAVVYEHAGPARSVLVVGSRENASTLVHRLLRQKGVRFVERPTADVAPDEIKTKFRRLSIPDRGDDIQIPGYTPNFKPAIVTTETDTPSAEFEVNFSQRTLESGRIVEFEIDIHRRADNKLVARKISYWNRELTRHRVCPEVESGSLDPLDFVMSGLDL